MINQNIIGLSGHIAHGKTSIVRALSGKNTDTSKEEALRGMTINIGFAFLKNGITLIDVPGHERFVRHMLSGVVAIDLALLIIAADEGVKPQTTEHLQILNMLKTKRVLVVVTKSDLVDQETLDLLNLEEL